MQGTVGAPHVGEQRQVVRPGGWRMQHAHAEQRGKRRGCRRIAEGDDLAHPGSVGGGQAGGSEGLCRQEHPRSAVGELASRLRDRKLRADRARDAACRGDGVAGQHVGSRVRHVDADNITGPQPSPGKPGRGALNRSRELCEGVGLLLVPPYERRAATIDRRYPRRAAALPSCPRQRWPRDRVRASLPQVG